MVSHPSVSFGLQTVTVTVSVPNPTDADAVAFLVPYDANPAVTAPQKFQWLTHGRAGNDDVDDEDLKTGKRTLTCATQCLHKQRCLGRFQLPVHRCKLSL